MTRYELLGGEYSRAMDEVHPILPDRPMGEKFEEGRYSFLSHPIPSHVEDRWLSQTS